MLVVNYVCHKWHKYYFLCNYLITLFNPFQSIFIRSSDVLIMFSLLDNNIYIYISLLYYNSDVVVMSHRNQKKFAYAFL